MEVFPWAEISDSALNMVSKAITYSYIYIILYIYINYSYIIKHVDFILLGLDLPWPSSRVLRAPQVRRCERLSPSHAPSPGYSQMPKEYPTVRQRAVPQK
jgi:hypothetical protein